MGKKVYRFHADLRPAAAPAPPVAREHMIVNEETRREMAWQGELSRVAPASLNPDEWEDALAAEEFLVAYNASLKRAQEVALGSYSQDEILYHVFFDAHGNKNVITQPLEQMGRRLSHLQAGRDGFISRFSLETSQSQGVDLDYYMKKGIVDLEEWDLRQLDGFWITETYYNREFDQLVSVERWRRYYDRRVESLVQVPINPR